MQYGDWEGDARCKGRGKHREGQRGMSSEGRRIWSIKIGLQHHWSTHQVSPFWWFLWTFLTPLSNFGNWTHYDSHKSLEAVPIPHWVKSSIKSSSIFILIFHDEVTVFHFYYSFSFDLSSDLSCCSEKELFWKFPLDSLMSITYRSQKCC